MRRRNDGVTSSSYMGKIIKTESSKDHKDLFTDDDGEEDAAQADAG